MIHLAELAANTPPPNWSALLIQPLHFLIYDLLCPLIYLLILALGIELALPGGTPVRALFRRNGAVSPVKIALANDPATRILSWVALLLALAFWATVVTFWLSGYLHDVPAPRLLARTASTSGSLVLITAFIVGFIGGDLWVNGVRTAQTARTSLGVLSISMALSATLLTFYIIEPALQDVLLVTALGIFTGMLGVVARHPSLFHEGLFDVLRSPLESDEEEIAEDGVVADDDISDSSTTSTGGWLTTRTRAIRERLATQKLGVGTPHEEQPVKTPSGNLGQPGHPNPTRPV
jgi:hypothetical protein